MAASASSSQVCRGKYDVFISFRGSDIRHQFLSHLIKELRQTGIDLYVDERLESGDEISSTLVEAIEGSLISLVIFSKDYASSRWCLEELVKIVECKEAYDQIVMPIFYNVDPSHVRHQKDTYADAFAKHKEKFKDNMDKLQIWRSTLTKVANLSGYHYSSNFQNESELLDAIVKDVLKKLDDKDPIEHKRLVGFDQNFVDFELLMEIELQEVRILGIWGTGGIGKTTLARAIFDKFSSHFESRCFLKNVREESKNSNGLGKLSQKLLCDLLNQEYLNMNDALRSRSIMRRLHRRRVLIVLDDVDTSKQLKDLAGEQLYLGSGSRVIVTSRDKHVLISGGILENHIHEVQELDVQESLKLFCLNAFNQSHPKMGYEELSKMTAAYAGGIPLALEVLGSHFHSRDKAYWESGLSKLQKYPHQHIQNVLKVSYDGLDPVDRKIFLDIAFFFVGEHKDVVTRVLDACDLYAVSGIENLVNKALIKISLDGRIEMHDLIRDMCEQIVRDESMEHPERRSRLKNPEEVCDLLENNMGTDEIEGLILDTTQTKDLQLNHDTFTKMRNLRVLKFYFYKEWHMRFNLVEQMGSSIKLPFGLESFSNKLRYLHWDKYPLKCLPLGFCPEKLVELRMEQSCIKKLWDGVQDLVNLKTINLRMSKQLMELPDFSMARKLEIVYLIGCTNLRSVHPSILSLHSLVCLFLDGCHKLEILQSETHLKSLDDLRVNSCDGLKEFCLSSQKMTRLDLQLCEIEILHLPIGRFTELRELRVDGQRLKSLPINELCYLTYLEVFHLRGFTHGIDKMELHSLFDAWINLRDLYLGGCSNLSKIPENISSLTKLESLSLARTSVESLPSSIEHLSSLTYIDLSECRKLKSILGLPPVLGRLTAWECTLLETVFSHSPVELKFPNDCHFDFKYCVKLDESSLLFITELTHFSLISAASKDGILPKACYPGSRVPMRIPHKHTANASNTVEFICNLHQLRGFLFCCVLPQFTSVLAIRCYCSIDDDDTHKFCFEYKEFDNQKLNVDHVYLWYEKYESDDARTSYNGKLACEFFYKCLNHENEFCYGGDWIKACGVYPIYASELESVLDRKRERDDADIDVEEGLPPTKKLEKPGVFQATPPEV